MPNFNHRSTEIEIMDDFALPNNQIHPVLKELQTINKLLGGFTVFYDAFKKVKLQNGDNISDWGCGGGDSLQVLNQHFTRKNQHLNFTGIDATPAAVEFAQQAHQQHKNICFLLADVLKTNFKPAQFDVVISSLFTHHFDDESWVLLIQKMVYASKKAVVINDLHRHWFAYYSIGLLTQLFSKSAMVKSDSKLSVLRSFKRKELEVLLQKAGIYSFTIKWMWAFRWQIIIYK
ncbi:MAG: methyltransferase domain-containing protein [Sphingobacteriales bacterium]|nr:MAG: methyltransferase domain-containing protein [Sphingobacteriales bacterium]